MSTILIIDENCDKINDQVSEMKGVYSFAEKSIPEALKHMEKEQLDIILCQVTNDESVISSMVSLLESNQPDYCKVYWLAFDSEKEILDNMPGVANKDFFIKPLVKNDIESLSSGNLLDQHDIDDLFLKLTPQGE